MGSLQDTAENKEISITIPPIFCPFPCRIHPDAQQMMEISNAWLLDRSKRITAAYKSQLAAKLFAVNHLVNSAYSLLVSVYYANAISTQRLLPIYKLMNWFFMIDTCVDEPGMFGADDRAKHVIIESVMALFTPANDKLPPLGKSIHSPSLASHEQYLPITHGHERCIEDVPQHASKHDSDEISSHTLVLHTPLKHVSEPALHENIACDNESTCNSSQQADITEELARILTSTATEWWSDMCIDMPLSQQARLSETLRDYLSCILQETTFRSTYHLPDVHTYLRIRMQSIGWYPVAVLTEYTLCMELDQEAITNPLVLALKDNVCKSVILVNDVTSFCKEYERGDEFNIVMVLCFNKLKGKCEALPKSWAILATQELLQESMNEACEMIRETNQGCACMIEKIKGSPVLMKKPGMGAFLEAMGNYVAGNIYWHLTSERYGVCASGSNDNKPLEQIIKGVNILASHTLHLKQPLPSINN
nr:microbial terpene synthase-like protein 1 [Dryopteris fragrans]